MSTYFKNVSTLAELKKEFRVLVLANHPDRGGSTETMQKINAEFEQLYKKLEANKEYHKTTNTGYENDFSGATAREYTEHVYNEYSWKGSRFDRNLGNDDITNLIRNWLKETYPACKFSVNQKGYKSINVHILKMDFNPFTTAEPLKTYEVGRYSVEEDKNLNDRAKDVLTNIQAYVLSYNYDNSDGMIDYFDRGFYESFMFGSVNTPFSVEIPRTRRTGGKADPEFKRPVGPAHRAIKKALGRAYFSSYKFRFGDRAVLGEDKIYGASSEFYPLSYGGYKTALKRVEKLKAAGIICEIQGSKYSYICFVGYTPEIEKQLAAEDCEAEEAERVWAARKNEEQEQASATECKTESVVYGDSEKSQFWGAFEVVDYSVKAVALFGDTKLLKDELAAIGGAYNSFLRYGKEKRAGWVFSKKKVEELKRLIIAHNNITEALEPEIITNEKPFISDAAFQEIVSTIGKKFVEIGYQSTRNYLKDQLSKFRVTFQQLRYIAYLLSEYLNRMGALNDLSDGRAA